MAPEQLSDEGVDSRSDLFSLGVILYYMLTGYRPFQGNSTTTVCFKLVNHEPVPASALDDDRLQPAAFKVLCALSTYGDRDGWCWPSMGKVARRLGTTRQAVHRQVGVLADAGYVQITPRKRGDGSTSSHFYRLKFAPELAAAHNRLGDESDGQEECQPGVYS